MAQHDHRRLTTIEEIGIGYWCSIHKFARAATTSDRKKAFEIYINVIIETFYCKECSGHLAEYLKAHPLDQSPSYFDWSIDCHNAVNARKGKAQVTRQEADALFSDTDVYICTAGCDKSVDIQHTVTQHKQYQPRILTQQQMFKILPIMF